METGQRARGSLMIAEPTSLPNPLVAGESRAWQATKIGPDDRESLA